MPDNEEVSPGFPLVPASPAPAAEVPQFSTVEYGDHPSFERCRLCSNLISGDYFRVNGQIACPGCAHQSQAAEPVDRHTAFLRGLLFGIGGAILGTIIYSAVAIATGWTIGYLGLAVGWLVGKGILLGSRGLGGRRYQIAAVLLTYLAISFSAIPTGIAQYRKGEHKAIVSSSAGDAAQNADASSSAPKGAAGAKLAVIVGTFLLIGLASPFLEFTANFGSAAIGLFILFLGLRIAWTLTAGHRLAVDGPFQASAS